MKVSFATEWKWVKDIIAGIKTSIMLADFSVIRWREEENLRQKSIFIKVSSKTIKKRALESILIKSQNSSTSVSLETIFLLEKAE